MISSENTNLLKKFLYSVPNVSVLSFHNGSYVWFLFILWCFVMFPNEHIKAQTLISQDSTYNYNELNKILELARETNDQPTLAEAYLKLGDLEGDVFSDFGKSIDFYQRAIEYFKILKDEDGLNRVNQAIARRYIKVGFYSDAETILKKILENQQHKSNPYILSSLYFDLNKLYQEKYEYELAEDYLMKAESLAINSRDTSMFIQILFDNIHLSQRSFNLDTALTKAFIAFKWGTIMKDLEISAKSLYHIGYINLLKKDLDKAEKYLKKSLEILPSKPYSDLRKIIYEALSEVFVLTGEYQAAHDYLKMYSLLNDSIANKNRYESAANLAIKYGVKEKQTSIELLKIEKEFEIAKNAAQRRTLYLLTIGLFVVLISIYFIVKFYDQQIKTNKIINAQKEEINQQKIRELEDNIRISSMRSVIEGQEIERERIAKDLHDSLGGLISTIKLQFDQVINKNENISHQKEYKKAYQLLDDAVNEVRTISRNLQPSALNELGLVRAVKDLINRFEGDNVPEIDFQYYNIPEKMDKIVALSVYRIIQELLINSIKHANAQEILLQINSEDDELVIQYEDDGIGFDKNSIKTEGMGLGNIQSRVKYMGGQIQMDSSPGKGLSVFISVKYS